MIPLQPPLETRQGTAEENSELQIGLQSQCQDYVGHKLRKKTKSTMRLLMCNPNGLTGPGQFNKLERLKHKSLSYQLDALCIVEHGQNLRHIPVQYQLKHQTQGWWQHRRISQTYNKHFDTGNQSQVGGVSIILADTLAHRSSSTSNDPTGLGRWTSILVRGKQSFVTRIVCTYRPCKSSGPETAYIQQALYFHQINRKGDPRKLFMEDLASAIIGWRQNGERIIVVGDFNTGDKTSPHQISRFWSPWLQKTGLIDVHGSLFGSTNIPSTHERGKVQIDYIFVSPDLTIKRAGLLPFSKFPGDHRALWVDIELKDMVGYKPPSLSLFTARRLKLQDPRIIKKYLTTLKQLLQTQNTLDEISSLLNISATQWSHAHTEQYTRLSITFRSMMLEAEKRCRKFKTGKHPWSPIFDIARKTKFYWDLTVKKLLGLKVPTRKILSLHKKLRIKTHDVSLSFALSQQKLAQTAYNNVKRRSRRYRITFRESLAAAIATHKKTSVSAAIRELINREETREMHTRIKWMRKKYNSLNTSSVFISDSKGKKTLVTEKSSLEQAIISENERKFHQTEGFCPLMDGTLFQDIGIYATGPAVPAILSGTYKPPRGTGRATKAFLKACQRPKTFSPSSYDHLSQEHYERAWSKAKENTGSGLVHFGHWKAGILDKDIMNAEWSLTMLPAKHGFSPIHWRKATDVMILKKEGVLDIEKLRTIVLYEADFNFLNKCVGRQMMDNAMVNDCMAPEQYAKPRSSAQEQCLTRRLIFDLVRYTRSALAMACSDLKSCYDRIVHNAASLAMQKCGISQEIVTTMFQTIQQCQHSIRTAYGNSTDTYGGQGKYQFPPMGAGQGNGAGPQMWAVLSATLFLAMHMEGLSTQFCQKMTGKMISLTGFMYVDDMDIIRICDDADSSELTEDLQLTLSYWNKLVKVTGGALEPNKSGWYSFHQIWDPIKGNYKYEDIGRTGDITAHDQYGKKVPLSFISCHNAQEMIGVKMTPTGDFSAQIQTMYEKSQEEARYLQAVSLSETDTRHALLTSIYPRLAWPLLCMSISLTESKQLLRPVLKAALPKMGLVSSLGYDYIHGSTAFQGLGIPELFHSTYAKQLEVLVDHLWKETQTGHFIAIAIQEFILEAGSAQHPLSPRPNTRLSQWLLTDKTWFAALHKYVLEQGITVTIQLPLLHPRRENDITIMDILDRSPQFTPTQLREINICRIYKKVTFLSDITTGDGKRLAAWAFNDQPNSRQNQYSFNRQDYPSTQQWSSWKVAMRFINQMDTNRLLEPLGRWTVEASDFINYWDYFYDHEQRTLLHHRPDGQWISYPSLPGNTRSLSFLSKGTTVLSPNSTTSLSRTTILLSRDYFKSEGFSHRIVEVSPISDYSLSTPTEDTIRHLADRFQDSNWALRYLEMSDGISQLLTDFKNNKAIMVGDGSYDDIHGVGAGAYIISSADGIEYIYAGGPTPGPLQYQSAYRSELGTIVGMGIMSHVLSQITNSSPSIIVSCDNDNALSRPFNPRHLISANQKSADLISLAHDIWHASPVTALPTNVRGHADAENRELSQLEKLNCLVDSKAKEYLGRCRYQTCLRLGDPNWGLAHISVQNYDITGRFAHEIQEIFALQRSKAAAIRNQRITQDMWSQIDHRSLSRSAALMSTKKKIFMTKWTSGQLPIGTNLTRRRHRIFDTCPCCRQTQENMEHLITCSSDGAIQTYTKGLETISAWMRQMDTDPIIHHHLLAILSLRRSNPTIKNLPYPCVLTHQAHYQVFKEQGIIGWKQFTEGLISSQWAVLQHKYYSVIQSRRNGKTWASQLISKLWDLNFQVWSHRNQQLHSNSNFLNQLHGTTYLDAAIIQEIRQGKGNLPSSLSPFFLHKKTTELMDSSTETKLKWFKIIRTARESSGTDTQDEFSHNHALRKWAGLRPL